MESKPQLNLEERVIFSSRYLLVPMYFGMVLISAMYTIKFGIEIWRTIPRFMDWDLEQMMVMILTFVDMVMVANLVSMITIGSQSAFVNDLSPSLDRAPQWIKNISSGLLKIKMGTSLIGVSTIHLLKSFLDADKIGWDMVGKQLAIHVAFLLSSLILAIIESKIHPHPQNTGVHN